MSIETHYRTPNRETTNMKQLYLSQYQMSTGRPRSSFPLVENSNN